MKTTFKHYIENPAIEGSTSSQSEIIRKDLAQRFTNILLRAGGSIYYALYRDSKGNYYIHAKIPDEAIDGVTFDVVIEFQETTELADKSVKTLSNYEIRFFSNDPAFMFTYTYTFNKHDLLIKNLKSKLSKRALTEPAKIKNPHNTIGVIKNFFFLYEFMKNNRLFYKMTWLNAAKISGANAIRNIVSAEDKLAELQQAGQEHRAAKKATVKPSPTTVTSNAKSSSAVKYASKVTSSVKKAPVVKMAKRAKYVSKKK